MIKKLMFLGFTLGLLSVADLHAAATGHAPRGQKRKHDQVTPLPAAVVTPSSEEQINNLRQRLAQEFYQHKCTQSLLRQALENLEFARLCADTAKLRAAENQSIDQAREELERLNNRILQSKMLDAALQQKIKDSEATLKKLQVSYK